MTIIVFLVDTSASMCQRAHVNGVQKTYLDIAKGAVETFLKFRQRSQDCMGDRYMLLTFEDPPNNVKAGWKENHATFMNELKTLQANGLTSMGEALKNAFDLLNLNRMQSGIDTYGQGRCPFYLEPSVIIVLTDGGKYTFRNGVHSEIVLPLHAQMPGTKLTKEPFRWDQRLFSLVLRMPGHRVEERADGKVPHDESMIEKMCEVTGGRSYKIRSHYVLNQCIESLVQKVQPGVVIHFDQMISNTGDMNIIDYSINSTKRMIYVPKQHPSQKTFPVGYWPIPEPYWPDPKLTSLPPRDAHPKIKILLPCHEEPQILRNFPIDKYELEPSPLTLHILSKKEPNKVWPLIVSTGLQGEMPFGYLKPNSTLPIVHLYVLPYNYQMLLPLINDLFHKFNLNPPNDWVYKFTNYVKTIPQYYCPFLRRALATTPNVPYQLVQYILPENLDSYLSPAVANYLKQMKNTAKQDQENLCMRVLKQLKQPKPAYHQLETVKLSASSAQKTRDIVSHPMLKDTFAKMHSEIVNYDNYNIIVPTIMPTASTKNYRNPFDIPRRDLIDEMARMREIFFHPPSTGISLVTKDSGHCLPISDMGNYQEYLKNKETPLRELEPTNVRQHMFGNPYKKDKNMVMVDEADLNDVAPIKSGSPGPHQSGHIKKNVEQGTTSRLTRKRKAGPIRKDYVFKRSALDAAPSSPCSMAREGLHMMSDLSSDDESSSGFTSSSDNEDDTEGCLVMVLDTAENDSVEPIGFVDTGPDAIDKGVKKAGGELVEKVPERQCLSSPDMPQSLDDNQSGASGTSDTTISSSKSPKVSSATVTTTVSTTNHVATTCQVPQHNIQSSNVNQTSEDEVVSVGEAKLSSSQPPSSSIIKQTKTPASDDALKEQHEKKRQVEGEAQSARPFGETPEVADSVNWKKARLHQQEQLAKPKKVPSQQHSDPTAQLKKAPVTDLGAVLLPEKPEHLLPHSVIKLDGTVLPKHESEQQRSQTGRLEMHDQHNEQQQVRKQPASPSDEKNIESEPSRQLVVSTDTNEQVEHLNPQNSEQLIQAPRPEKKDEQLDQNRSNDLSPESNEKQLERGEQLKVWQTKLGTPHSKLVQSDLEVPIAREVDHAEHLQPTQIELKLKVEDDLKESEQTTVGVKVVPAVEATTTTPPDHSQEQAVEQPEPVIPAEQQASLSLRKPPQQQQQLETVFQQRPMQRNHQGSQWNLSNSASPVGDASSDMTDVQKISNILKTCHNGGDSDKDKNRIAHFEVSPAGDRATALHESGRVRTTVGSAGPTDPDTSMALANGNTTEAAIVTNGRDAASTQPTLNWNYDVALYSYADDEDEVELERIDELNLKTRAIVFRDIRRPGRDYTQLLKHLELIQGSRYCKKKFVDMCISEARRFRRHRMVDCIQEWWERHVGIYIMDDQNKNYFTNDAAPVTSNAVSYQGDGFIDMPPSRVIYINSGINSGYGAEFSHNNYHFSEEMDDIK